MPPATLVPILPSLPPPLPVRRFTVDEYHRIIAAGVLTEDDAVELLEGWIVPKMPHNPPHDATLVVAQDVLRAALPPGWHVRPQCAIWTPDSEPEPDLVIVAGQARDYLARLPSPSDIGVVIEVSDSTLRSDREVKGRLYARAAIPVYWIINLVDRQVEVYADPTGPTDHSEYRRRASFLPGGDVPLNLGGAGMATVRTADLIPEP